MKSYTIKCEQGDFRTYVGYMHFVQLKLPPLKIMKYYKDLLKKVRGLPQEVKDYLQGWLMLGILLSWMAPIYRLAHGTSHWTDAPYLLVTFVAEFLLSVNLYFRIRALKKAAKQKTS